MSTDIKDKETPEELNLHGNSSKFPLQINSVPESDRIEDPRIEFMLKALPKLNEIFNVHFSIGSGTFSSVYLATLKSQMHERFSNRKKFAIKYLLPTSHPKRIEKELECLQKIGGSENVVNIHFCMRNQDSVVFVMPYLSHGRFTDYMMDMGPAETQLYIKNLLIAVRSVHRFNVIHRDVKPANFLYDRINKKFLLVDMGLAHFVDETSSVMPKLTSLISSNDNKRKRSSERENGAKETLSPIHQPFKKILLDTNKTDFKYDDIHNSIAKTPLKQLNGIHKTSSNIKVLTKNSLCNSRTQRLLDLKSSQIRTAKQNISTISNHTNYFATNANQDTLSSLLTINQKGIISINDTEKLDKKIPEGNKQESNNMQKQIDANQKLILNNKQPVKPKMKYNTNARSKALNRKSINTIKSTIQSKNESPAKSTMVCTCFGKSSVCKICCSRKPIIAKREGTPGFRPPEVLLKYTRQTTAVDIWAVGIVLLCILSRCYPFFDAPDDLTALAEMITLFGTERMKNVAQCLGRSITVSCQDIEESDLRQVCYLLRNRKCSGNNDRAYEKESCLNDFPDSVYDLLSKLLDLNPFTRITAEDALSHPFFNENLV